MKYQLTAHEARVIGCLLEKQVTTPEQYPLSVNAVVTACNQKTNREPVMSLSEGEVQALLDTLVKRHYLRTVSGFGNEFVELRQVGWFQEGISRGKQPSHETLLVAAEVPHHAVDVLSTQAIRHGVSGS